MTDIQLTWADLIIDDFNAESVKPWLGEWEGVLSGQFAPLFLSKFGDWFIRRPNGSTEILDVLEGELRVEASTPAEFTAKMNDQEWQENNLLSFLVYQLHQENKVPGPGQCYAIAPHPAFGGDLATDRMSVMDIHPWQSICAQIFKNGT